MPDAPDVERLLRAEVVLEVPFRPSQSPIFRAYRRALRRLGWPMRPRIWRIEFVEPGAAHALEYMRLGNEIAEECRRRQEAIDTASWAAAIDESLRIAADETIANVRIWRHISGSTDDDFWAALSTRQRKLIFDAYEAVNPVIGEAKKKLTITAMMAIQERTEKAPTSQPV